MKKCKWMTFLAACGSDKPEPTLRECAECQVRNLILSLEQPQLMMKAMIHAMALERMLETMEETQ
jgi:hypothetical protein